MLSRFVTCAVTKPILLPRALAARKVCSRCRYVNKRKLIEEENPLSSFANIANFYQSTNFFCSQYPIISIEFISQPQSNWLKNGETYATVRLGRCKFGERKTKCHKCNVHCCRT